MSSGERVGAAGRRGTSWESSRSQGALALKALAHGQQLEDGRGRDVTGAEPTPTRPRGSSPLRQESSRGGTRRGAESASPGRRAAATQPDAGAGKGATAAGLGAGRWRGVGLGGARLPSSCLGRGSGPRALTESSLRTHRCAGAS